MKKSLRSTLLGISLCLSASLQAEPESPLLRYEKGEIIPVVALALDKTGANTYTLRLPPRFEGRSGEPLRTRMEKDLAGLAGIKLKWQGSDLIISYEGPDTPLLQALAAIKV